VATWGTFVRDHWRTVVHWAVVGGAVGYLAWRIPAFVGQAAHSGSILAHLDWRWIVLAIGCGIGALLVYGEMHRQLLLVGDARLSVTTVQGINMVENAVSTTIPVVGGAGALAYAIDQLRRRGVDAALASWSVLVAGLLDTLVLVAMGALALAWAHRIPLDLGVILALAVAVVAVGGWTVLTHPGVLRAVVHGLLRLGNLIPIGCPDCRQARTARTEASARRLADRLALLRPGASRWLLLTGLAVVSWALDYFTLTCVVAALGFPVPWPVLAVGFLVVQGSIALQIFPGGAGLAETGLLGVIVATGAAVGPAAATVLIYRAISWLGLSMLGWIIYGIWIQRSPVHLHRHVPELAAAPS
jgi:uncharacterized membrane protein YbhN (UPF0104 family)